jgi:hypothetical protein
MVSVNVQTPEALSATLPANQMVPFLRLFWDNWQGIGQKLAPGVFEAARKAGLVADLVALQPVLGGQALALAPQGVDAQALAASATAFATNFQTVAISSLQVVSIDTQLFVSANPGTNSCGFVQKATAASTVTGMCIWAGAVLVSLGGASLSTFNSSTGAFTAFATAHAAELIASYQGVLFASVGNTLYWLIPAVGSWSAGQTLDSAITSLEELDGVLYIGTATGLYRLKGQLKAGSPSTAPNVLNQFDYTLDLIWRAVSLLATGFWPERNFAMMKAWRGSLWAFVNDQLLRITPTASGVRVETQNVQGPTLGLAVCGRFLVTITRKLTALSSCSIWVNDSDAALGRWWKLDEGGAWCYPFPNAGYNQGLINVFNFGTTSSFNFRRWLLDPTSPTGFKSDNYSVARTTVTGKVTLPLMTPEDFSNVTGGKVQAIKPLRVGLEWVTIDALAWWPTINIGALTNSKMRVEISLDAGTTWNLLVDPATGFDYYQPGPLEFKSSRMELPIDPAQANSLYPASPNGNGLILDPSYLIRVTWEGGVMPLLRRVWLDVKPVDIVPGSGRVWDLDLAMSEPFIGLDGAGDSETGLIKVNRLWSLWTNSTSVVFTDIDGANYRVKVAGMEAKRAAAGAMPGLAPGWAVSVKLAEVFE